MLSTVTDRENLYKDLLIRDGRDRYLLKIVEELNELACAVLHYSDMKIEKVDLLKEFADVTIQLEKINYLYGDVFVQSIPFYNEKMSALNSMVYNEK